MFAAQEGLEAVYGELSTFGGKVAHTEICYYIVFTLVCGKGHVQCIKCGVEFAPCLHPVAHVERQFYLIFTFAQADLFSMSGNWCSCWVFHVLVERVTTPDCSESLYMFTWMRAFFSFTDG